MQLNASQKHPLIIEIGIFYLDKAGTFLSGISLLWYNIEIKIQSFYIGQKPAQLLESYRTGLYRFMKEIIRTSFDPNSFKIRTSRNRTRMVKTYFFGKPFWISVSVSQLIQTGLFFANCTAAPFINCNFSGSFQFFSLIKKRSLKLTSFFHLRLPSKLYHAGMIKFLFSQEIFEFWNS